MCTPKDVKHDTPAKGFRLAPNPPLMEPYALQDAARAFVAALNVEGAKGEHLSVEVRSERIQVLGTAPAVVVYSMTITASPRQILVL